MFYLIYLFFISASKAEQLSKKEEEYINKLKDSSSSSSSSSGEESEQEQDKTEEVKDPVANEPGETPTEVSVENPLKEPTEQDENKEIQRLIHQLSLDTEQKVKELDDVMEEKKQNMAVPFQMPKDPDSPDGSKQATFKEPERPKLEKQPTVDSMRSRQSSISSYKDPVSPLHYLINNRKPNSCFIPEVKFN